MKQIRTLEELKREAGEGTEFFIKLNYNLRSTKWIVWNEQDNQFFVENLIDDTEQFLTPEQIMDENHTNIGKAMKLGALFINET